jgi:hypothetical protein
MCIRKQIFVSEQARSHPIAKYPSLDGRKSSHPNILGDFRGSEAVSNYGSLSAFRSAALDADAEEFQ